VEIAFHKGTRAVSIIDYYFKRANEIIGERTPEEEKYDDAILRALKKGKTTPEAIKFANKLFPREALEFSETTLPDLTSHYRYLLEHERILKMLGRK